MDVISIPSVTNLASAAAILAICPIALLTLHLFAMRNGTFESFFKLLEDRKLPSGKPFQAWTTDGVLPRVDWQIRAFGTFVSSFTENLSHPATSLSGFLFTGAWGPAWYLIVMESFRNVNRGYWLGYLAIPGYLIFHHGHGLFTPLYLGLAILFLPSCRLQNQNPEALFIPHQHLGAIPISFLFGFVLPVTLMCLPAPRFFSHRTKDTITGWYQQWHLIIEVIHYVVVGLTSLSTSFSPFAQTYSSERIQGSLELLRANYSLAMLLAVIPYLVTTLFSIASWLAPTIFSPKVVESLHPKRILIPTWPRKGLKAANIEQGLRWLIQWDFLLGTIAFLIWAITLRLNAATSQNASFYSWYALAFRTCLYFVVGGPNGLAVGLMWERDEIVFSRIR